MFLKESSQLTSMVGRSWEKAGEKSSAFSFVTNRTENVRELK